MIDKFQPGEYIIYVNGEIYRIGRIVKVMEDAAFVCYHCGETAAKTPFDKMHHLVNSYYIKETELGGGRFDGLQKI